MNSFAIKTPFGSEPIEVLHGQDWEVLRQALGHLADRPTLILIDNRVEAYHGEKVRFELGFIKRSMILVVIASEIAKEVTNAAALLERVSTFLPAKKESAIVAIGGGSLLNVGGFFASVIGRGVDFHAVPTTPMSMADVAFGSKHALNTKHHKNYVGTYRDPASIVICEQSLSSIEVPRLKLNCIESLKQFLATDRAKLELMAEMFQLDRVDLSQLVTEVLIPSALQKIDILNADPQEENSGRILMLGHQVAHALEVAARYRLGHDRAVAIGIYLELRELLRRDVLSEADFKLYETILDSLNVEPFGLEFDIHELERLMLSSKLLRPSGSIPILNIPRFGEISTAPPFIEWSVEDALTATRALQNER